MLQESKDVDVYTERGPVLWVYPLVESTHVWSLALFVGFTVLWI